MFYRAKKCYLTKHSTFGFLFFGLLSVVCKIHVCDVMLSLPCTVCPLKHECGPYMSHHGSSDEHALIVCQSKLASVWRCLGTQSRFHSCHHPAYVHKIIINKQARQSHFNNNNLAFRGRVRLLASVPLMWNMSWLIGRR